MVPSELVRLVAGVLDCLDVPYFVTGSVATAFFGKPRFTNDVDVVADLNAGVVAEFGCAFPSDDFYVSLEAAREAVAHRDQFNIIQPDTGLKIDIITPKRTPFDESRLKRKLRVSPRPDYEAWFSSLEDAIVKKMDFYREGGSEKHLRDIRRAQTPRARHRSRVHHGMGRPTRRYRCVAGDSGAVGKAVIPIGG